MLSRFNVTADFEPVCYDTGFDIRALCSLSIVTAYTMMTVCGIIYNQLHLQLDRIIPLNGKLNYRDSVVNFL